MHRSLVLVVLAGCGRFGFDGAAAADGAISDAELADAPPPTGPFGAPAPVASLNTGSSEDDASLTGDQLEIFFDSNRGGGAGGGDLWTATRVAITDPWSAPVNIAALNTAGDDATPDISRDGLTLYWVSAGPLGQKDIYYATRPTRAAPWGAKVHVPEVSSAGDDAGPCVAPGGLIMYFSSDLGGTDALYVSTRASTSAPWGTPALVTELNAPGANDSEPFVNGANTYILWSSDRGGNRDLWFSRRGSPDDPWGPPQPLAELNTPDNTEGDPWLSPDEHVLYFARGTDLYVATR